MDNHAVLRWLQSRADSWRELNQLLILHKKNGAADIDSNLKFIEHYQTTQSDLALARAELGNTPLTRQLESLLIKGTQELSRPSHNFWADFLHIMSVAVPNIMRSMMPKLLAITFFFWLSIMSGWLLVQTFPELAGLFLSPQMIEDVQHGNLWTEKIFNIMPSSVAAFSIMTNNIMVTFTAFALGIFYGLGTIYIVLLNGLLLGSVFAYTNKWGLAFELLDFIVAHGFVELSIILIASTAGFTMGESIARPGQKTRLDSIRDAARRGITIIAVCVPFLVIAGIIEGYISPSELAFELKLTIGVLYWVAFVAIMSGRVFGPLQPINYLTR